MPAIGEALDDVARQAVDLDDAAQVLEVRLLPAHDRAARPDRLLVDEWIQAAGQLLGDLIFQVPQIRGPNRSAPLEFCPGEGLRRIEVCHAW